MRVYVVAFGKLKTPGLREAADYYLKLSKSVGQVEEIELKPLPVPEKSAAQRTAIQEKETTLLLEKLESILGSRGSFYLLDEMGKAHPTREWSELITTWEELAYPAVALCVGSSLGFGPDLKKKAKGLISLGPQTLPHELARVNLLEQVYRAYSVKQGHPYHNA